MENNTDKNTPSQDYERICNLYKTKQIRYEQFKIGLLILTRAIDWHIDYKQIETLAKELRDEQ